MPMFCPNIFEEHLCIPKTSISFCIKIGLPEEP